MYIYKHILKCKIQQISNQFFFFFSLGLLPAQATNTTTVSEDLRKCKLCSLRGTSICIFYSTKVVFKSAVFLLFQMWRFLVLVLYRYSFSLCSIMGLVKSGSCLLQLSLFGSCSIVESVSTTSSTTTRKLFLLYPPHTWSGL